jgi:hypothetical protein
VVSPGESPDHLLAPFPPEGMEAYDEECVAPFCGTLPPENE